MAQTQAVFSAPMMATSATVPATTTIPSAPMTRGPNEAALLTSVAQAEAYARAEAAEAEKPNIWLWVGLGALLGFVITHRR